MIVSIRLVGIWTAAYLLEEAERWEFLVALLHLDHYGYSVTTEFLGQQLLCHPFWLFAWLERVQLKQQDRTYWQVMVAEYTQHKKHLHFNRYMSITKTDKLQIMMPFPCIKISWYYAEYLKHWSLNVYVQHLHSVQHPWCTAV